MCLVQLVVNWYGLMTSAEGEENSPMKYFSEVAVWGGGGFMFHKAFSTSLDLVLYPNK